MFTDVTIKSGTTDFESLDHKVQFKGTYTRTVWNEETPSILLLGTESTLYWPYNGASLGACRAYFELTDGENARAFKLNFGENETTSLSEKVIVNSQEFATAAEWYTLEGKKLEGQPTKKGIYIMNGKKVVVK